MMTVSHGCCPIHVRYGIIPPIHCSGQSILGATIFSLTSPSLRGLVVLFRVGSTLRRRCNQYAVSPVNYTRAEINPSIFATRLIRIALLAAAVYGLIACCFHRSRLCSLQLGRLDGSLCHTVSSHNFPCSY